MRLIQSSQELKSSLRLLRKNNKTIGFVPTMGYLHEGHLSLIRLARKENKTVVVSIFVNPLQFGPREDFWRYPRNLVRDAELLKRAKVDFLFHPILKEFYSEDFQTSVSVKFLSLPLCGVTRPTHFSGVATVVLKLMNIVMPDAMYMGQKDYQQFRVIEQMTKDLDINVRVKMAPIIREADGLAMSSRNVLLSSVERREAPFIHRSLEKAKELIEGGVSDTHKIKKAMKEILKFAPHGRLDYAEIVDASSLAPVVKLTPDLRVLVALAVVFGKTRLIDNILITG